MKRRTVVDGAAGLANRGAFGGDLSEVCGERHAGVPLEGQPRPEVQVRNGEFITRLELSAIKRGSTEDAGDRVAGNCP